MFASFSLSNHMLNQLAKLKILLASLFLACATIMPAGADDHAGDKPTGRDIMRDAYALMNHFRTVMAEIDLKVESKGKSRERQLVLKTKHSDANTKIIAKFTAPGLGARRRLCLTYTGQWCAGKLDLSALARLLA